MQYNTVQNKMFERLAVGFSLTILVYILYNTLQTKTSMSNKPLTQNIVEILQQWFGKYFKHNMKTNLSSLFEKTKKISERSTTTTTTTKGQTNFSLCVNDKEAKKGIDSEVYL